MNISRIIKTRRKELGMTQEQMADRLGVSAPAVNKWEKHCDFSRYYIAAAFGATFGNRFEYITCLSRGDDRRRNCGISAGNL